MTQEDDQAPDRTDAQRSALVDDLVKGLGSDAVRVGELEVPVQVTDEMMPGVVSLPHGFGHDRPGTRQRIATQKAGVSMNDLTDATVVEGMLGTGVLTAVPVRVSVA